jgi:hypothetical protein
VWDEVDPVEATAGAVDLVAGLDDDRVRGQARQAGERVRDGQRREVDDVDRAHARHRLPDQVVVDLLRRAGAPDERDMAGIGQKRQRRPHRPFHVEADREDREAGRRLQVAHAALVHAAHDDRGSGPEVVARAEDEVEGLRERGHDHVEALLAVLRAVDRSQSTLFQLGRAEASDVDVLHLDADPERPVREQAGTDAGRDGRRGRQAGLAGQEDEDGRLFGHGMRDGGGTRAGAGEQHGQQPPVQARRGPHAGVR